MRQKSNLLKILVILYFIILFAADVAALKERAWETMGQPYHGLVHPHDVYALSAEEVWAVGETDMALHMRDGGKTWIRVRTMVSGTGSLTQNAVTFISQNRSLTVSD